MNSHPAGDHFRRETDSEEIVWLHIDRADSGTNTLSIDVLDELDLHLQAIAAQSPRGLVILSDKKNGFIAGADIKSLIARVKTEAEALDLLHHGQAVFNRLADLSVPTVALIHGFCLGGGAELALACRYRVARDDPGTRLGMPEVRLGLHPGWGGSARLVPLLGGLKAMDLILSGRSVDARQAGRMGLVDRVVPERHLRNSARQLILRAPPPHRAPLSDRWSNSPLVRPLLAGILRRQVAKRAPREHYPSPYAMIDSWRKYANQPEQMLRQEAASFARLITGSTAKNLIRVFFLQEQLKSLGKDRHYEPRYVHVIGAGTMGGDIAAWCALRGFHVSLQDQAPERIAPAMKRAAALFRARLKQPRLITDALDRLMPDHKGTGVARADIVIEAIFEDAEVKRSLYSTIEPMMKADAVLATNTSSIPLEELATVLTQPGRLVGLHFFNPVAKMQLVEVVRGQSTSEQSVRHAMGFTRRIDRLPLPVTSTPGFLVNRNLMPYLMEALVLESEGVPAGLIDKAATAFGMPVGPVELADTVGLDICLHVARILAGHFHADVPQRLQQLVANGCLGRKTGCGFYTWKKGRAVRHRVSGTRQQLENITDRLILRLLNESVSCLREQVVGDADLLDAGMIFGTGFAPFRGGPVNYIRSVGPEKLLQRLRQLSDSEGDRFAPDSGWSVMADDSVA